MPQLGIDRKSEKKKNELMQWLVNHLCLGPCCLRKGSLSLVPHSQPPSQFSVKFPRLVPKYITFLYINMQSISFFHVFRDSIVLPLVFRLRGVYIYSINSMNSINNTQLYEGGHMIILSIVYELNIIFPPKKNDLERKQKKTLIIRSANRTVGYCQIDIVKPLLGLTTTACLILGTSSSVEYTNSQ